MERRKKRPFFHSHPYLTIFPGLGEALIFFCFFSSIKGRKEDYEGKKKTPILGIDQPFPTENTQGAYAIRPYNRVQKSRVHVNRINMYPANLAGVPDAPIPPAT